MRRLARICAVLLIALSPMLAAASTGQVNNPIVGKWRVIDNKSGTVPSGVGDIYIFNPTTSTAVGRGSSQVKYQIKGDTVIVRWPSGEWMQYVIEGNDMKSADGVVFRRQK